MIIKDIYCKDINFNKIIFKNFNKNNYLIYLLIYKIIFLIIFSENSLFTYFVNFLNPFRIIC